MRRTFPKDFLWGTATSAYQIEGAVDVGGRGESIWDRFARQPGAVSDGTNGDVACDHFHRFRQDVAMMKELGLRAYRFSIAWPRVIPDGVGAVASAGLDYYDELVDTLLAAGIRPLVTLNHWDMPQRLQDEGGWPERATVDAFSRYAQVVARRLGDRVHDWVTHNEPWCMAHLGYQTGEHAPGEKDPSRALRASHHLLLSHGRAVPILRAESPGARVGIVLNLVPSEPASPSEADAEATRAFDGFFNRWYLDPLYRGSYPADAIADRHAQGHLAAPELPWVLPGDLPIIGAKTDFLGVNYYSRAVLRSDKLAESVNLPRTIAPPTPDRLTDMGWEVFGDGLRRILVRLHTEYSVPCLYVTENGAAYSDGPGPDGRVQDARRVSYVRDHLVAVHRAIEEGANVAGYFLWSLLDNYEWQFGYSKRFGIVWVDYETQRRTPKASAHFYRDVIAQGAVDE
jgi:beta-glucosidase